MLKVFSASKYINNGSISRPDLEYASVIIVEESKEAAIESLKKVHPTTPVDSWVLHEVDTSKQQHIIVFNAS